jgi:5-carboxymethyl-2-hydroxymuconate isomerase
MRSTAVPHQIVEYSSNLESQVDIAAMIRLLHETVAAIDAFPRAALRTRVARRDQYCIADHDPANAFVHVLLRIASGRGPEVKKAAGDRIFQVLCDYLAPVQETTPLGISFELQEIDPVFRWKKNNLPAWLEKRATAANPTQS